MDDEQPTAVDGAPDWIADQPRYLQNAVIGAMKSAPEDIVREALEAHRNFLVMVPHTGKKAREFIERECVRIQNRQAAESAEHLEPELREKAKERQQEHGSTAPGKARNTSDEFTKSVNTRAALAEEAGLSEQTIGRAQYIDQYADDETEPDGRRYNRAKRAHGGDRTDLSATLPEGEPVDTRAELAKASGLGERTICQLAEASGFHLSETMREVLDVHRRLVIKHDGWGKNDPRAAEREHIKLTPAMSNHGNKRSWGRYKAARAEAVDYGLLEVVSREPNGAPLTRPTWHLAADPVAVWQEAARRQAKCRAQRLAKRRQKAEAPVHTEPEMNAPANGGRTVGERCGERSETRQAIPALALVPGPNRTGSGNYINSLTGSADALARQAADPLRAKSAGSAPPLGGGAPAQSPRVSYGSEDHSAPEVS